MTASRGPHRATGIAGEGSFPAPEPQGSVSHNLAGQKLGRKGRGTRDRILAAAAELLAADDDVPISLSAVARRASLGMTSLYNYFTDLTELLLAVLEPVMASAEAAFIGMLRERWPDDELGERCKSFMLAYYNFWSQHSRLLHLRNSMADARDRRMMVHRVTATRPIISLVVQQMNGKVDDATSPVMPIATVLMTGIERTVTVATDVNLTGLFGEDARRPEGYYLLPAARMMELMIRDARQKVAGTG
jgi:AcrR family transcriptional regulator